MIESVEILKELQEPEILNAVKSLEGELEYEPPIFAHLGELFHRDLVLKMEV